MVAVAITKKEKLFDASALFQAESVIGEKFTGNTHQRNVAVEQRDSQPRPHAIRIFVDKVGYQFRKESLLVRPQHHRIAEVYSRSKRKAILLHRERWIGDLPWFQARSDLNNFLAQSFSEGLISFARTVG